MPNHHARGAQSDVRALAGPCVYVARVVCSDIAASHASELIGKQSIGLNVSRRPRNGRQGWKKLQNIMDWMSLRDDM